VQFAEPWRRYLREVVSAADQDPAHVGIYPIGVHLDTRGRLGQLFDRFQRVDSMPEGSTDDAGQRATKLAQVLAQKLGPDKQRIKVFISHSRQKAHGDDEGPTSLTDEVRDVIAGTHLNTFFDAVNLQPGDQWRDALRSEAATSAMLVLRTDMYASRPWCQEEMRIAKCAGVPIVVVDDLHQGEERGSFLADHLPRVPAHLDRDDRTVGIRRALSILVDECLKRALWQRQQQAAAGDSDLAVAWWSPHAPEPLTLLHWLRHHPGTGDGPLLVLHPDPPLGEPERKVLDDLAAVAGISGGITALTPRGLATRGG
jgi:hypothetical protein